ncbi:SAE2 C-terminal domain-containing protein [Aspergillus saccharolyticus JOP 1030-1]|uniref:SAE2-domain-containing protein n=1 Tax=Aspergillus saccharolyticus JOP 1030-1 TaxID=1450539 RepID=A0A318Z4B6_9EURO|nr:SAE2-domain-containing protein [Aspergillus saccharolyticus JOP 1030-1]PYH41167.1 SAE2-domain-containing protein [Aspergillus saccharolyticus JOP 1030-1]
MEAIKTLRSSLARALESSFDEALKNATAEISCSDISVKSAEEKAINAAKERTEAMKELKTLKDAVALLHEELRLTGSESVDGKAFARNLQDFEATYAPNQVLDNLNHTSNAESSDLKTVGEAYTALYKEAQELVKASCELRKQLKRYKGKWNIWQKCLEQDRFTLVLDETAVEFKCTRKVFIGSQRPLSRKPSSSVPISGSSDFCVADQATNYRDKAHRTHHPDVADSENGTRSACDGSLRLSSAQNTPIPPDCSGNEEIIQTTQVMTSTTRLSESEFITRQGAQDTLLAWHPNLIVGAKEGLSSFTVTETRGMYPSQTFKALSPGGIIGTQDLDEVGSAVATPRKRRKVRDGEGQGVLSTTATKNDLVQDARSPLPLFSASPKRSTVLQPVDDTLRVELSARPPHNFQEVASARLPSGYISSILEDGDERISSPPPRKLHGTNGQGASGFPLSEETGAIGQRLHSLLEARSSARLKLQGHVDVSDRVTKRRSLIETEETSTPCGDHERSSQEAEKFQKCFTNETRATNNLNTIISPLKDVTTNPARSSLRAMPLQHLKLGDFKINTDSNQGHDFAFHSVVRKKDEVKCVKGCTRYNCCGKDFLDLARLNGLPADAAGSSEEREFNDQNVIAEYLGDEEHELESLRLEDRNYLLQEAKAWVLANQFGKHRQRHQRAGSPPGFWRTDMPSTQELARDHEEAEKCERGLVKHRYREAMRPGGLWKFADE